MASLFWIGYVGWSAYDETQAMAARDAAKRRPHVTTHWAMDPLDYWRLCNELSVIQAALLIVGVDPSIAENSANCFEALGRRVVYRKHDLEVWLESRVAPNTSDADARLPKSLTHSVTARLDARSSESGSL